MSLSIAAFRLFRRAAFFSLRAAYAPRVYAYVACVTRRRRCLRFALRHIRYTLYVAFSPLRLMSSHNLAAMLPPIDIFIFDFPSMPYAIFLPSLAVSRQLLAADAA